MTIEAATPTQSLPPADRLALEFRDRLVKLLHTGYFGSMMFTVIIKDGIIDHTRITPEEVIKASEFRRESRNGKT